VSDRVIRHVISSLVTVAIIASLTAATPGALAMSGTRIPLNGFFDLKVDRTHRHVFITGEPTANSSLAVLDYRGQVITTIDGLFGASGMVLDRGQSIMYVALNTAAAIVSIDTATLSVLHSYPLGAAGQCPGHLALARELVWFGFTCGTPNSVGIGSLNPATGKVITHSGAAEFSYNFPVLANARPGSHLLFASDIGVSPPELYKYRIGRDGQISLEQSLWEPCGSANLQDIAVFPTETDVLTASGYPYHFCAFRTSDLIQNGTYDAEPNPVALAIAADGVRFAGGAWALEGDDIFVHALGDAVALARYDLAEINPPASKLYVNGIAFDPTGRVLFAVTGNTVDSDLAVFNVIGIESPRQAA
jgi:hypothetical protein